VNCRLSLKIKRTIFVALCVTQSRKGNYRYIRHTPQPFPARSKTLSEINLYKTIKLMSENIELPIERLEAFEERLGVKFESLFIAKTSNDYISINGELHTNEGLKITQDIELVFSAYNASNSVVGTKKMNISSKSFLCFETFSCFINKCPGDVSKVRIYPKQR
jgi:hypothetical protein